MIVIRIEERAGTQGTGSVLRWLEGRGLRANSTPFGAVTALTVPSANGWGPAESWGELENHAVRVFSLSTPYPLASRMWKPEPTVVRVGDVAIGEVCPVVTIAGPCSVESREQILAAAGASRAAGAQLLRGGCFKPRTSPYSFQGLGETGLRLLAEAGRAVGLPVVTEVMAPEDVGVVAEHADVLQVGARNMANFALLRAVGRTNRPVLLKRGLSASIDEWLQAAEYVLAEGNSRCILCERGIRTFETATRNTLDLSAVPAARLLTHLPIVVDPSHGTGRRSLVAPMARAAVAAGADGLMLEMHPEPGRALSDGDQALTPADLLALQREVAAVAQAIGRAMATSREVAGSRAAASRAVPAPSGDL